MLFLFILNSPTVRWHTAHSCWRSIRLCIPVYKKIWQCKYQVIQNIPHFSEHVLPNVLSAVIHKVVWRPQTLPRPASGASRKMLDARTCLLWTSGLVVRARHWCREVLKYNYLTCPKTVASSHSMALHVSAVCADKCKGFINWRALYLTVKNVTIESWELLHCGLSFTVFGFHNELNTSLSLNFRVPIRKALAIESFILEWKAMTSRCQPQNCYISVLMTASLP